MYVAPAYRGAGLAGRLLDELHAIARERGCRAARLDTSAYLSAAVALYRSAGYTEVADYNGNVKADLWFERRSDTADPDPRPTTPPGPRPSRVERAALEGAIGDWATGGIHHVGSTAVPGLAAKPIVDILVGVEDLESVAGLLRAPRRARIPLRALPQRGDALVLQAASRPAHAPPAPGPDHGRSLRGRARLQRPPARRPRDAEATRS